MDCKNLDWTKLFNWKNLFLTVVLAIYVALPHLSEMKPGNLQVYNSLIVVLAIVWAIRMLYCIAKAAYPEKWVTASAAWDIDYGLLMMSIIILCCFAIPAVLFHNTNPYIAICAYICGTVLFLRVCYDLVLIVLIDINERLVDKQNIVQIKKYDALKNRNDDLHNLYQEKMDQLSVQQLFAIARVSKWKNLFKRTKKQQ